MKVEAIIIDGKKYVPMEKYECEHCILAGSDCTLTLREQHVCLCELFGGRSFQEEKEKTKNIWKKWKYKK